MDRAAVSQRFFDYLSVKYPLPANIRVNFMTLDKDFIYLDGHLMAARATMASDWALVGVAVGFGSEEYILKFTAHEYKHLLQNYVEGTFPPTGNYLPEDHPTEVEARAFGKAEAAEYLALKEAA